MFRNCFAKIPIAKIEKDEELKEYLQKFYIELDNVKKSKGELFRILANVGDKYYFKSADEKLNRHQKKILLKEMEDEILKIFKN